MQESVHLTGEEFSKIMYSWVIDYPVGKIMYKKQFDMIMRRPLCIIPDTIREELENELRELQRSSNSVIKSDRQINIEHVLMLSPIKRVEPYFTIQSNSLAGDIFLFS